jgi:hypothetical protein
MTFLRADRSSGRATRNVGWQRRVPQSFYSEIASVTAAVERQLSPSAFLVNQDRVKSASQNVLPASRYSRPPNGLRMRTPRSV